LQIGDHQPHAVIGARLRQLLKDLPARVVDIGHRDRIDAQPPRRIVAGHEGTQLLEEVVRVGVVQRRAEPVDDEARLGSRLWRHRFGPVAAMRANTPANATYCDDPAVAIPVMPANITAAVAESAPTTRWRDDPSRMYTNNGSTMVYNPVITGIPAIVA
jgi:hypothetical protein